MDWYVDGRQHLVCLSLDTIDPLLLSSCKDALELATMHSLAVCEPASLFADGESQGIESFRVALAQFLKRQYEDDVSSDNLMVTSGATQALILICNVFFEKGDTMFVEEPLAPKQLDIFTGLGLNIVPVSVDEHGFNVTELEKHLSATTSLKEDVLKPFSAGVFLTPCYHNPTGTCLAPEKCHQLVEVMNKYNCLCLSNDIYQCFCYDKRKAPFGVPPKRLVSYDISHISSNGGSSGHVLSVGSFSTIFSPGLRMGWIEALPSVLQHVNNSPLVRHSGSCQQYLAGVMESVMSLGLLKDSFESLRFTFHTRLEHLCKAITQYLPQCSFVKPKGGLFIWLSLPSSVNCQELLKICKEKYAVDFLPGTALATTPSKFKNYLRLSASHYGDQTLINAVARLGEALKEILEGKGGGSG